MGVGGRAVTEFGAARFFLRQSLLPGEREKKK
jgi:hypothetical protein